MRLAQCASLGSFFSEEKTRRLLLQGLDAPALLPDEIARRLGILDRVVQHDSKREASLGAVLEMDPPAGLLGASPGEYISACVDRLFRYIEYKRPVRSAGGQQYACAALYEAFCNPYAPEIPVETFEYASQGREVYL